MDGRRKNRTAVFKKMWHISATDLKTKEMIAGN